MSIGPISRPLITNPTSASTASQNTSSSGFTIDDRAAKVIKAATGITLDKNGAVVDNPNGGMPPWPLILDINDTFNGRDGVAATPQSIANVMTTHKFTPRASYDPSLMFGVWDSLTPKPKGSDSTFDVTA